MEQAASHTSPESSSGHGPAQREPGPEGTLLRAYMGRRDMGMDLPTSGWALLASLVRRASALSGQVGQGLWAPRVYGMQIQKIPEPSHSLGPSMTLELCLCPRPP